MKKLFCILTAIAMLCSVMTVFAFGATAYDWELNEETYAIVAEVPFGFQLFTMDNVNYSWVANGGYRYFPGNFGDVVTQHWTGLANSFFMTEELTAGYTKDPKFGMQVTHANYLQLPAGAAVGDTGESARYKLEYKDIIIKAPGYADVIVPGAVYESLWLVKQENGYTSGASFDIDFVKPIKEQLGLDTKGLVEYMLAVDEVEFEISFTEFNGITAEEFLAYEEVLIATVLEALAGVQPYLDEAEAAKDAAMEADKAVDDTTDLAAHVEVLKGYLATAQAAYDNAVAAAGDNADALVLAEDCVDAIKNIQKLITRAEEDIAAAQASAEEETPAETPEDEKPADEKPADEKPADEKPAEAEPAEGGSVGIVIAIVAVVVVAVVVIVILVAKKKKK